MIKFIKNNKILFIVIAIVIVGGACLAAILIGNTNSAMKPEGIKTAVDEASETAAPGSVQTQEALSSKGLSELINSKETRRNYVIPSLDGNVSNEAKTWKSIEPDNFAEIEGKAIAKTIQISKGLFSFDVNSDNIKALYYTDTDKDRKDIIKVTTSDDAIVCTLSADTLDLIEIDYYFIPYAYDFQEHDNTADEGSNYSRMPDASDLKIADRVAAYFGTSVKETRPKSCSSLSELLYEDFNVSLANGKYLKLATLNGQLYAVAVYPTEACWNEAVYFEADVQYDPSVVRLESPQNFTEGQPGNGDMTQDEAKKMYLSFLNLANGTGDYPDPTKMIFFIDHSGARENYWHIEGDKLSMDLSSKSKWIISLTCSDLWNSTYDVPGIERKGYSDYINNIMKVIYGSSYKGVRDNAVYDGGCCTEDALMADGTQYEFMFQGGTLKKVDCFANDDCFKSDATGWKADHVYINSATEKEFIPED